LHYLYQQPGQDNFQLLWQTGNHHFGLIESNKIVQNREDVHIVPFIDRMNLAYTAADIIVSRAGAIAISELCIIGKPVILIPSPNVAEDHQTKNAEALVKKSAALMINDRDAVEKLFAVVTKLVADNELQNELGRNIKTMAMPEASGVIAKEAMKLIRKQGS
jgi:UDP-N-acetylglucosamine--N-acetylmuramyl-(pentapeptide) pyrophosphoryl-undecaprenol N-acetylglucosamine transferase